MPVFPLDPSYNHNPIIAGYKTQICWCLAEGELFGPFKKASNETKKRVAGLNGKNKKNTQNGRLNTLNLLTHLRTFYNFHDGYADFIRGIELPLFYRKLLFKRTCQKT